MIPILKTCSAIYDAVVIGGGLGGLLAAATVAKAGGAVLVVERLPFVGGRFTTVSQEGYEITTGALHMVPHGHGGVLAHMLEHVGTHYRDVRGGVCLTLFVDGRHFCRDNPFDRLRAFQPLTARGRVDLLRMIALLCFGGERPVDGNFAEWLACQTGDPTVYRLIERFIHFALSVRLDQIRYAEMRAVARNFVHYGLPSAPLGGCRALIDGLTSSIRERGGKILVSTEAVEILFDRHVGRVCGVRVRNRRTKEERTVLARVVVSDVGPTMTASLLSTGTDAPPAVHNQFPTAAGLKLHVVSDQSLIPHRGVMLCLDTQRIAGIVQVSNAVPTVAPRGMHMLDTFQVLQSDDIARERRLAIEDLRYVFGAAFDRHCRVLRASAFRGGWPVNRAVQGLDLHNQAPLPGLLMVGDAYKPAGHMMVEGVAASVQRLLPALTSTTRGALRPRLDYSVADSRLQWGRKTR